MKAFLITVFILGLIAASVGSLIAYAHGEGLTSKHKSLQEAQQKHAAAYVDQARVYAGEAYALLSITQTSGAEPARDECLEHVLLAMYVMSTDRWDGREPDKARPGLAPTLPRAISILDEQGVLVSALSESLVRESADERADKLATLYDNRPRSAKKRYSDWDDLSLSFYQWFHPPKKPQLQRPAGEFSSRFERETDTDSRANKRIEAYRAQQNITAMQAINATLHDFDHLPYGCESLAGREQAEDAKKEMAQRSSDAIAFGWNAR